MILLFVLRSLRAEYNMLQWHKTAQKNAIKSLEAQHIHTHTYTGTHMQTHAILSLTHNLNIRCHSALSSFFYVTIKLCNKMQTK